MSGDDSTLGTLPLGWSLLVGLAIVAVLAVCVVRIVRERHRDKLAEAWDEGWAKGQRAAYGEHSARLPNGNPYRQTIDG